VSLGVSSAPGCLWPYCSIFSASHVWQAGSAEALAYTALVAETAAAFRAVNPGSQVCMPPRSTLQLALLP
jgi:hypothetical protein